MKQGEEWGGGKIKSLVAQNFVHSRGLGQHPRPIVGVWKHADPRGTLHFHRLPGIRCNPQMATGQEIQRCFVNAFIHIDKCEFNPDQWRVHFSP